MPDVVTTPAFLVFAALLAATGLMRLGEVVVSVRRMRNRPEQVVSEPWLFPLMVLLHTGLIAAPLLEVALWNRPALAIVGGPAVALLQCEGSCWSGKWNATDIGGSEGSKFDLMEAIDLDADGDLDLLTCEEVSNLGVVWYENPTF